MNNKLHLLRRSLFGSLLFLSSFLLAQPVSPVNNGNVADFMDDMEVYFGDIMQVSEAQLLLFVNAFLNSGTTSLCPEPVPTVVSQDASQITFDWPTSSSTNYRVGHINLLTGAKATTMITQNSHSFTVDDGLYAFVFQKYCGTGFSSATIIIYDKVVGLTADPNLDCNCRHKAVLDENLQGFAVLNISEFDLWIMEGEAVAHQMHFKKECPTCPGFNYNPDCLDSGGVINSNDIDYLEDGEEPIATIAFTSWNLALQLNLADGYAAELGICKTQGGSNQNGGLMLQVVPVGPQLYRVTKAANSKGGASTLLLFNQSGQLLNQWTSPKGNDYLEEEVDLSQYPAGMYFLRVADSTGISVKKLIRL